jgi:HEAT repeat protein
MLVSTANKINQNEQVLNANQRISLAFEIGLDPRVERNLVELSPVTSWGDRQIAAKSLGNLRDPAAVPGLLTALQHDNFWMVRCAIIQALEKISDPRAIPVLILISQQDGYQVVRSYAAKAVERLSGK